MTRIRLSWMAFTLALLVALLVVAGLSLLPLLVVGHP